jgi:hypothetical protein
MTLGEKRKLKRNDYESCKMKRSKEKEKKEKRKRFH